MFKEGDIVELRPDAEPCAVDWWNREVRKPYATVEWVRDHVASLMVRYSVPPAWINPKHVQHSRKGYIRAMSYNVVTQLRTSQSCT